MPLSNAAAVMLEMDAEKNGFNLHLPASGDWLGFGSNQAPLKIWLTIAPNEDYLAAFSLPHIAEVLTAYGALTVRPLPPGAVSVRKVASRTELGRMLRAAFDLSRHEPERPPLKATPLQEFLKRTASMPKSTEVERLAVERLGQEFFRAGLDDHWSNRCAVTGLGVRAFLRASHIKPWKKCASDAERLDPYNGLLLAVHYDAAFDQGFITFRDDGAIVVSEALTADDCNTLGIDRSARVKIEDGHRSYLAFHREHEFEKWKRQAQKGDGG